MGARRSIVNIGLNAVVGRPKNEWGMEPARFAHMRKAAYDVDARVDDMNVNGNFASLGFGTFIKFDGSTFVEPSADGIRKNAYRVLPGLQRLASSTSGAATHPTRFIPLANLPLLGCRAQCVEEIRRVEAKGCHAVTFPTNPAGYQGIPSLHDASLGAAVEDLQRPARWSSTATSEPAAPRPTPPMQSPIEAWITGMPISIANAASDWITLDGVCSAIPDLKMALSEGGIGWVPYLLERADFTNRHHKRLDQQAPTANKLPSDIFREHILTCFIEDDFGLANRHAIGIENITPRGRLPALGLPLAGPSRGPLAQPPERARRRPRRRDREDHPPDRLRALPLRWHAEGGRARPLQRPGAAQAR